MIDNEKFVVRVFSRRSAETQRGPLGYGMKISLIVYSLGVISNIPSQIFK